MSPTDILTREGFTDAWKRATALPGEPHWDEDFSIPCDLPPSDRIAWCDPIPDMEQAR